MGTPQKRDFFFFFFFLIGFSPLLSMSIPCYLVLDYNIKQILPQSYLPNCQDCLFLTFVEGKLLKQAGSLPGVEFPVWSKVPCWFGGDPNFLNTRKCITHVLTLADCNTVCFYYSTLKLNQKRRSV